MERSNRPERTLRINNLIPDLIFYYSEVLVLNRISRRNRNVVRSKQIHNDELHQALSQQD
jgi:hypothetical protein